ncbi:MAG: HEAT repeat domain-containing protein [Melioribacteraceae bacterium]|nr:HEAT repeat domain-containing protein [Melioribacteraceae bacterium]
MLTKEYVSEIKANGNGDIKELVNSNNDNKSVLFILENLGYLPNDFDDSWVQDLLTSKNKKIRLNAVKTLGKVKDESNISLLSDIAKNDESTDIRREAVSSIGRMRSKKAISLLLKMLDDIDPKIVSQAIRGLLVFKGDKKIDSKLRKLLEHENEMIQVVIQKEYFSSKSILKDKLKHPESYDYLKNTVVLGDVRDTLITIPDESFHLTFTSPPYYNARDYSIYSSYKAYLKFLEEVFRLTYDKTKEGRFLIVNTSPVIVPRISRQYSSKRYPIPFDIHNFLTKMGWEFIDDIIWEKPEASVKNRNAGFLQHRKPLAYKPNARTEYLMVYRKQTDKLIDWNIKQYDWETVNESKVKDGYETSNVWEIDPKFDKVHSAVFPIELCKRVIEYYSFKGDLVFDPFGGSGTFGRTAKLLDRYFFLTEQEPKYFDYMKSFLKKSDSNLFNKTESKFLILDEFKEKIK